MISVTEFDTAEVPPTVARPQSPPPATDAQAHGALNPLAGSRATGNAWEFAPGVWAWMEGSDVVLQSDDGDVTIPGTHLAVLARSLLAAHVQNGRPEFRGQQ